MLQTSLDPGAGFGKRRLVQPASARAGAPVLEQGRAIARSQILENHVAPAIAIP